ncbi:MAG: hypothetical protein KIT85_13785 [Pseudolabrys sp.]|nr:hypothetical protein [Pseudolabrys sp.]
MSGDTKTTSMLTPNQWRKRAEQFRAAGKTERADQMEKLALMIERRDDALERADSEE